MPIRKVLLRVMLASLGLAAVCGAGAILVAPGEVVWRVVWTAVATAIGAGVMMAVTLLIDREKSRWAGVLGMWLIVLEYLGTLLLIWEIPDLLATGWDLDERVALTMLFLALTMPPAMLFLRLMHWRLLRATSWVGLAVCALVLVMLEISLWPSRRWWEWEEMWGSAWVVGAYGLLAAACLIGFGQDRRHWRWVGIAAAAAGCAVALWAIWFHLRESSATFTIITSIACFVALASAVMAVPLLPGQGWVRWGTIASAGACAFFVDVDAVLYPGAGSDLLRRVAGAGGFVAGCGVLALAVLARLNRGVGTTPVLSEIRQLALICPGCAKKQTAFTGDWQCPTCGLRFHIRIEEPRCPQCGYLLYMLKSDRCPECGAPTSFIGPAESAARGTDPE